jgi:hypothetical protein
MRAILAGVAGVLTLWLTIGEKPWVAGHSPTDTWKRSQYVAVYLFAPILLTQTGYDFCRPSRKLMGE